MEYFVILVIGLGCPFLLSAYLLKKAFAQMRDGPISPMCVQKPPVILTNQFWPVRQEVLKHLGLDDLKNLGSAFPSLRIEEDQCYNKRQLERDLLLNEKVFGMAASVTQSTKPFEMQRMVWVLLLMLPAARSTPS